MSASITAATQHVCSALSDKVLDASTNALIAADESLWRLVSHLEHSDSRCSRLVGKGLSFTVATTVSAAATISGAANLAVVADGAATTFPSFTAAGAKERCEQVETALKAATAFAELQNTLSVLPPTLASSAFVAASPILAANDDTDDDIPALTLVTESGRTTASNFAARFLSTATDAVDTTLLTTAYSIDDAIRATKLKARRAVGIDVLMKYGKQALLGRFAAGGEDADEDCITAEAREWAELHANLFIDDDDEVVTTFASAASSHDDDDSSSDYPLTGLACCSDAIALTTTATPTMDKDGIIATYITARDITDACIVFAKDAVEDVVSSVAAARTAAIATAVHTPIATIRAKTTDAVVASVNAVDATVAAMMSVATRRPKMSTAASYTYTSAATDGLCDAWSEIHTAMTY